MDYKKEYAKKCKRVIELGKINRNNIKRRDEAAKVIVDLNDKINDLRNEIYYLKRDKKAQGEKINDLNHESFKKALELDKHKERIKDLERSIINIAGAIKPTHSEIRMNS